MRSDPALASTSCGGFIHGLLTRVLFIHVLLIRIPLVPVLLMHALLIRALAALAPPHLPSGTPQVLTAFAQPRLPFVSEPFDPATPCSALNSLFLTPHLGDLTTTIPTEHVKLIALFQHLSI